MSMTREEAITLLKYRRNIISSVDADWNANEIEAMCQHSTIASKKSGICLGMNSLTHSFKPMTHR